MATDSTALVLFDGYCNLCNGWVSFVLTRDRRKRFRFATLQGEAGQTLLRKARPADNRGASIVLIQGGVAYSRSTAALRILQGLGFPWAVAAILRLVPPFIRDAAYDLVARNRYRWFGRRDTCRVPTDEEAGRFLA